MDEAEDFLSEILPFIESRCPNLDDITPQQDTTAAIECIGAIIKWASNMKQQERVLEVSSSVLVTISYPCHFQVLRCVRTGVSYHGKPVLAICLEDVAQQLPYPTSVFRQSVKKDGLGANNISKDFLPSTGESTIIKRGSNCRSRKCTIVLMEKLPQNMQSDILEGMSCLC